MSKRIGTICVTSLAGMIGWAASVGRAQTTQPSHDVILVLPFTSPAGAADAWMGKAVQQDLLTDLTQATVARVIAPASAPAASDNDAALGAARQIGATTVIYGQAQAIGSDVRLSGQVLDVSDGKALGAIKSTGPKDDLFHLEDALAGQVFAALPRAELTTQAQQGLQRMMAAQQAQQPGAGQANPQGTLPNGAYPNPTLNPGTIYGGTPQPQAEAVPVPDYDAGPGSGYYNYSVPQPVYSYVPDYGYAYPDYGYAYPYAGWGFGWPFWGTTFFVSPGFGFGHHEHDHDFGHHWNGGSSTWDHSGFAGGNGSAHGGNGFAHTGSGFAHTGSGFGAGFPRANAGFSAGASSAFSAGRLGGSGFHSAGVSRGFSGGGGFHASGGAHAGGFSSGGGFHGSASGSGGGHR